jgi:hypothetical protein
MKLKFFTIPAVSPEAAEADLNRFLGAHRVSHVERHFTADGAASFWAICVTWVEAGEGPGASLAPDGARRGRIDYREVLEADEFALYDRLRTLRKQTAEAEGLPPFAVFTNEQLADMVRRRAATLADLGRIEGTSQHFANQYLGEADRFALARPECRAHARYMDDLILWCDSRAAGRALHRALVDFLGERLGLHLKPPCLLPSSAGLGFCGMRVYPGTVKLGHRRRRAWSRGRRRWEGRWQRGEIGAAALQRAYASLWSVTLPADSLGLRRAELARRPPPVQDPVQDWTS